MPANLPAIESLVGEGRLQHARRRLRVSGHNPRMSEEALLEAVRGLRVSEPDLGFKPLLAKLRAQQPDLGAATKEARVALAALTAESEAREAAAAPPTADGVKWLRKGRLVDALCSTTAPAKHGEPAHFNAQNEPVNSHGKPYVKPPPPGQRGCNGGSRAAFKKREKEKEKRQQKSAALAAAPCEVREGSVGAEARARCDRLLEAQQEAEREAKQEAAAEAARLAVAGRVQGVAARNAARVDSPGCQRPSTGWPRGQRGRRGRGREGGGVPHALAAAMAVVVATEAAAAAEAEANALQRAIAGSGEGGSSGAAGPSGASEVAVPDQYMCSITAEIMTNPVSTVRFSLSPPRPHTPF